MVNLKINIDKHYYSLNLPVNVNDVQDHRTASGNIQNYHTSLGNVFLYLVSYVRLVVSIMDPSWKTR